jgi:hypothetical protein
VVSEVAHCRSTEAAIATGCGGDVEPPTSSWHSR